MSQSIVLSGDMASGKSTVANWLALRHGFAVRSFGSVVRAFAVERGLPNDRSTLQDLGQGLFTELGPAGFVTLLIQDAPRPLAIDGVRHLAVRDALRDQLAGLLSVYLATSPSELDERWAERGDAGARLTVASHEVERDLAELRKQAALVIDTSFFGPEETAAIVATASAGVT